MAELLSEKDKRSCYCAELSAKNMARKTEELYSSLFLATKSYQKRSADAIVK